MDIPCQPSPNSLPCCLVHALGRYGPRGVSDMTHPFLSLLYRHSLASSFPPSTLHRSSKSFPSIDCHLVSLFSPLICPFLAVVHSGGGMFRFLRNQFSPEQQRPDDLSDFFDFRQVRLLLFIGTSLSYGHGTTASNVEWLGNNNDRQGILSDEGLGQKIE